MFDYIRLFFVKTIFSECWSLNPEHYFSPELDDTDILLQIRFGNLIKNEGDILLCPISEHFKPSNSLSRNIIKEEGAWLEKEINSLYSSDNAKWIGSEHVAFYPCRKLKYRGILFVCVDFYSENHVEINSERIAEAFEIASKYDCRILACPENILYNPTEKMSYNRVCAEYIDIIRNNGKNVAYKFIIDTIIKRNPKNYFKCKNTVPTHRIKRICFEHLTESACILPHYRKHLKSIRTELSFSYRTARQIRNLLTKPIKRKVTFRLFNKLEKLLREIPDDGCMSEPVGFAIYLLRLCNEMPWNFHELNELLRTLPKERLGEYFDTEFNFAFPDLTKFEYYSREKST